MSTVNDEVPAAPPHTAPSLTPGKVRLLLGLLLVLVTFAAFQQVPTFDFVDLDDRQNVFQNPYYLPVTAAKVAALWHAPYYHLYTPVTSSLWALCAAVSYVPNGLPRLSGGMTALAPAAFHTADLLLHIANVLLVFALLDRLTRRSAAAAAGALLFAVHPLQAEAVSWVTGTNNTLAAFFSLLALRGYVAAADAAGRRRSAAAFTAAATAAFALALLSKPTAVVAPLVALAIEGGFLRRPMRAWAPILALWLGMAGACALVTQRAAAMDAAQGLYLQLWGRPFVAGDALAFYLGKLALPFRLGFDYGRTPRAVLHSAAGYAAWLAPAGIALLLVRRRERQLLAACGVFAAAALPTLGLVPTYFQNVSTVADRYVYLALLGPALALAWLLRRTPARTVAAVAVPLAALLGVLTFRQAATWRTTAAVHRQAVAANPQSWFAYGGLATALTQTGDIDGAIAAARQSLALQPNQYQASLCLGTLLLWKGRRAEADPYIARADRLKPPGEVEARLLIGKLYLQERRFSDARREFDDALRIGPDDPETLGLLGVVSEAEGRRAEAAARYAAALRLRPDLAEARAGLERVGAASGEPARPTAPSDRRPR